jgi:hypothetical protein
LPPFQWIHRHHVILPLAALIAVLPLILNGCSCGHDFSFHLLNWMEANRQFAHGNLHPHWAFSPAYNAGEPRFVFYPPLSWAIGALLGFLMPWAWTPVAYTWLALTATGLALYRLAREFSTPNAALIAAAFYLVNPYLLFTAYERTAYAELLAAAWIPLLLLGILRRRVTIAGIAIPIALLWLTNDPAAVMSCYALVLLTLGRLVTHCIRPHTESTSPLRLATTAATGTLLGLSLSSFYLLPAAFERRYIQIAAILAPGTRIESNFLFHHTASPIHNAILNTASLIAVALLVLTAVSLAIAAAYSSQAHREGSKPPTNLLFLLTTLAIAIAILLIPLSNPIWQHLPELRFLQFPWRLLTILAAVLNLALALALASLNIKAIPAVASSLAITALLAFPGFHLFRQYCAPQKSPAGILANFRAHSGTMPSGEYTPIAASNQSLNQANPPFWLLPSQLDAVNASAPANAAPGPAPASLTLNISQPQILVLNLRDYPAWRITLNHTIFATHLRRSDGLIAIPVPVGLNRITVTYSRNLDQTIGDILSVFSLTLLLASLLLKSRRA